MTRKRWSSALLIVVMSFMAEGGNPPLNEAASWEPMGAVPVTVSREKAEPAIRAGTRSIAPCHRHPF